MHCSLKEKNPHNLQCLPKDTVVPLGQRNVCVGGVLLVETGSHIAKGWLELTMKPRITPASPRHVLGFQTYATTPTISRLTLHSCSVESRDLGAEMLLQMCLHFSCTDLLSIIGEEKARV